MNSNYSNETLEKMKQLLSIAADKTRLKIMLTLLDESLCECDGNCNCTSCQNHYCMIEKSVNEIAVDIGASQSLVSHQLKILKDANLVSIRKDKTKIYYSLNDGHVRELIGVVYEHATEEK